MLALRPNPARASPASSSQGRQPRPLGRCCPLPRRPGRVPHAQSVLMFMGGGKEGGAGADGVAEAEAASAAAAESQEEAAQLRRDVEELKRRSGHLAPGNSGRRRAQRRRCRAVELPPHSGAVRPLRQPSCLPTFIHSLFSQHKTHPLDCRMDEIQAQLEQLNDRARERSVSLAQAVRAAGEGELGAMQQLQHQQDEQLEVSGRALGRARAAGWRRCGCMCAKGPRSAAVPIPFRCFVLALTLA